MKLSELCPCAVCGGPIAPIYYTVTVERHLIDSRKVNQVLGLNQMLQGHLMIAEAMAPVDSVSDQVDTHTAVVCQNCGLDAFVVATAGADEEEEG